MVLPVIKIILKTSALYTVMTEFTIYVIFHKFLVPECYETLSGEDITDHVRFFSVNAKISKEVPESLAPYVICERDLQWYNPFLQHNRFCESSAFFHAYKNPAVFLKDEYIGFIHYDMLLKKEALEFLKKEIAATKKPVLFTQMTLNARPHLTQIIHLSQWNILVKIYNTIFEKSYSIYDVLDKDLPLYHSFVIHRETFHRMMFYAERAIPYLFEMLHFETKHLPYMVERLHGVFLALDKLDGTTWISLPGVIHQDRLKDRWQTAAL
jgi:hypothetical protein